MAAILHQNDSLAVLELINRNHVVGILRIVIIAVLMVMIFMMIITTIIGVILVMGPKSCTLVGSS